METTINPGIFKAYDVRGVYPEEINENAAYAVGRAFVSHLKCKTVVVGKDMRESSPRLAEALIKGITDQGANVIDIGMCTTPMLSFAVMRWNNEAGIMISASHNPAKYNGFKLIKNAGACAFQLYEDNGIKEMKELALQGKFEEVDKGGSISQADISQEYKKYMLEHAEGIEGLKIVVDYGNGVGSLSAGPVFQALPIEVVSLFETPDGSFPHHEPNPQEIKNIEPLCQKVVEEKADLGIFFDGDADRSVFVDEKGKIIFPDVALGILAISELKDNPGCKVYHDLRFTKAIGEEIKNNNGEPVMMRVGNPFYKVALQEENSLMAAELSGHIMYKEYYAIDDGVFPALKLMKIMIGQQKKASEMAQPFLKYFQTEEINMQVADPQSIFDKLQATYADGKLITIDGILIDYGNWWFSVRKSNTEPIIRLRIEAEDKDMLADKRKEMLALIQG